MAIVKAAIGVLSFLGSIAITLQENLEGMDEKYPIFRVQNGSLITHHTTLGVTQLLPIIR